MPGASSPIKTIQASLQTLSSVPWGHGCPDLEPLVWWQRAHGGILSHTTEQRRVGREDPPGGRHGNPLQDSCVENPMDTGAWRATVHGAAKSKARAWVTNTKLQRGVPNAWENSLGIGRGRRRQVRDCHGRVRGVKTEEQWEGDPDPRLPGRGWGWSTPSWGRKKAFTWIRHGTLATRLQPPNWCLLSARDMQSPGGWEIQSRNRREIRLHSNGPLAETDSCTRVTDYSYKSWNLFSSFTFAHTSGSSSSLQSPALQIPASSGNLW